MNKLARGETGIAITIAWTVLAGAGCAGVTSPTPQFTSSAGPSVNGASAEPYDGAKARLAVAAFVVKTPKAKDAIGDGLADMLATALFQSDRYIILERQALPVVFAEQELGASGRVRQDTAAKAGQIEGAELIIVGAVTEFDPGTKGTKLTLGSDIGGKSDIISGGTSRKGEATGGLADIVLNAVRTSHVAIDIRIIDARTARVVAATSVEGRATDFDLGGLGRLGSLSLGGGLSVYARTPMEKAIRLAIESATRFVASKTPAEYYRHRDTTAIAGARPPATSGGAGLPATGPTVLTGQAGAVRPDISPAVASTRVAPIPVASRSEPEVPKILYIKTAQANVRVEPSMNARILSSVKKTTKLVVLGDRNDWYRVRLENGSEGWVAASVTSLQAP